MNKVFLVITVDFGKGFKIMSAYSKRSKAEEALLEFRQKEFNDVKNNLKSPTQEDDFKILELEVE